MDEKNLPWQEPQPAEQPERPAFALGKKELLFAAGALVSGLALCNFVIFGGFRLGFAIALVFGIFCSCAYLVCAGCKPSGYALALLGLSVLIAAAFARSDDSFVKFVMLCFLTVSVNLGFSLLAEQNLRHPGTAGSLLDAPGAFFVFGIGRSPETFRGFRKAFRQTGAVGQKSSAVLLGAVIAVPVLAVVIPLLIRADAAFDGLMQSLPSFNGSELFATLFFGIPTAILVCVRGIALRHSPKRAAVPRAVRKGLNDLTVNTVLSLICGVYILYLVSQLAYFTGAFAGILPEEYTLAEYARRGFFEMAWLCAINLGIVVIGLSVRSKRQPAPLSTRLLCLFLGLITLFLVATASAKMFLYIGSFGLTRLRVLTQIIMLYLMLVTVVVMVWLFQPKLPYMKIVILAALILGAVVIWADVDTVVARYNVDAYLSGRLETVDVWYLSNLTEGAIPQLARLAEQAPDAEIAANAARALEFSGYRSDHDFRSWTYVNHIAARYQ